MGFFSRDEFEPGDVVKIQGVGTAYEGCTAVVLGRSKWNRREYVVKAGSVEMTVHQSCLYHY